MFASLGGFSYLLSLASFAVFALWISGYRGPPAINFGIDTGEAASPAITWIENTLLLSVLCLYHSGAARPEVKRWITEFVPQPLERSIYNLVSSLLLLLVMAGFRPAPAQLWAVAPDWAAWMGWLSVGAWSAMFLGISLIGHREFFGLRQVGFGLQGKRYEPLPPVSETRYIVSRIPLMLGMILIPWATVTMSIGHAYFSVFLTVYCALGSWLSKRDHRRGAEATGLRKTLGGRVSDCPGQIRMSRA